MYHRIQDCWNRPISSAPNAWMDVLDRDVIEYTSGFQFNKLSLTGGSRHCLNLGSYNYLGFGSSDPYCTPRVLDTLSEWGISTASSRFESGTTTIHEELETMVARFVGKEACITYGMGFATNSASIPALMGKGCLIVSDALNHASIVAGARSSGAKVKVFRHNDAAHLDSVLRGSIAEGQPRTHRPWKKIMVIVEGIYSMEGEVCNLKEIVEVKKKNKCLLYLDEAHSIGAMGRSGRGVCEQAGVDPADVDVMMGTFTKSFGSSGGYIAGSKELIAYLRETSPGHLYATSMSPAVAQQVMSAMKLIDGEDGSDRGMRKVAQLKENSNYFRRRLLEMGLDVIGDYDSPVMPIMIYHPGKLPWFSRYCYANNIAMVVVGFPATALLLTRARVCISAAHSREDLDYALGVIDDATEICQMKYHPRTILSGTTKDLTKPSITVNAVTAM